MIHYLKVEIKPFHFTDTTTKELQIQTKINGKLFTKTEIREEDDLVCFFDQIFDCAKKEIKRLILDEKE